MEAEQINALVINHKKVFKAMAKDQNPCICHDLDLHEILTLDIPIFSQQPKTKRFFTCFYCTKL